MIPKDMINHWRQKANWLFDRQVEQDLVISRALVELYKVPEIKYSLAFRGGTAFNKLFLDHPARYSEDIDFVQINDEPIGNTLSQIRSILDSWLGEARWTQKKRLVKLIYRFNSEDNPPFPLRLKIEINTVEPFSLFGHRDLSYEMESPWFSGESKVCTFSLEELMATKLRALFQRSKGRDLFDLWLAIARLNIDCKKIINCFESYNDRQGVKIGKSVFEDNLFQKMANSDFLNDIQPLLVKGQKWNASEGLEVVMSKLINHL